MHYWVLSHSLANLYVEKKEPIKGNTGSTQLHTVRMDLWSGCISQTLIQTIVIKGYCCIWKVDAISLLQDLVQTDINIVWSSMILEINWYERIINKYSLYQLKYMAWKCRMTNPLLVYSFSIIILIHLWISDHYEKRIILFYYFIKKIFIHLT